MKTSSRRPTLKTLALGAAALLPILTAAVALAITAADAPPNAPTFGADNPNDPSGGVFVYNSVAKTGTVRYATPAQAGVTIGYRLYLGTAARTAGAPYVLGNTPCDLGASTTANIQTCLVPPGSIADKGVHVAVTAYNQFGNEGNYSADQVFVPILPPSLISVTPPASGDNTHKMVLKWTTATVPATPPGVTVTVTTEVFRRQAGSTAAYTPIFRGAAETFSDMNLTRDTSYEYVFRSKATPTFSNAVSTYSLPTAPQTKAIPEDVFPVTIAGTRNSGNPETVTTLAAGERAVISQTNGIVNFDPADHVTGCTYTAGPSGISQATYDNNPLCYPSDHCNGDPKEGSGHAALLVKLGGSAGDPVGGGTTVTGTGVLGFFINDCSTSNNSGSFSARVSVGKP